MPIIWAGGTYQPRQPERPRLRFPRVYPTDTPSEHVPAPAHPSLNAPIPFDAGQRRVGPGAQYAPHARPDTRARGTLTAAKRLPLNRAPIPNPCGICGVTALSGSARCQTHTRLQKSRLSQYDDKMSPFEQMTGLLRGDST